MDDEIKLLLSKFNEGVKVVFILDCCYSHGISEDNKFKPSRKAKKFNSRELPTEVMTEYSANKRKYSALKRKSTSVKQKEELGNYSAGIIVLSACAENEIAYESDKGHGIFTQQILDEIESNRHL